MTQTSEPETKKEETKAEGLTEYQCAYIDGEVTTKDRLEHRVSSKKQITFYIKAEPVDDEQEDVYEYHTAWVAPSMPETAVYARFAHWFTEVAENIRNAFPDVDFIITGAYEINESIVHTMKSGTVTETAL
jgi:hypothetical protein